jgi:F-type H+-transporting ATPase subunit b
MDIGVLLNHTLFIQGLLFLIFLFLVHMIYVKPYSQKIDERNAYILELSKDAERYREEAAKYYKKAEEILAKASAEVNQILEENRKKAKEEALKIIEEAQKEAEEKILKAKEEINKEVEEAKKQIEEKIQVIAEKIVEKIVPKA